MSLNAKTWADLKKQLKGIEGKAIFKLTRSNSMNDGEFLRVLHKVKPHELVFSDGKNLCYLDINKDSENLIQYFNNGFSFCNCKYTLLQVMEV